MMTKHLLIAFGFIVLFACAGICNVKNAAAQPNLTGICGSNDNGRYYIRQVGNNIYWLGVSGNNDGRSWSNVFKGTIQGDTLVGSWADVPRGSNSFFGTLTFRIDSNTAFHRVAGAFGASNWHKAQRIDP